MIVERELPEDKLLPAAMRDAIRRLREERNPMMSLDEARGLGGILETGAEVACYLEKRGYYKPEGCIVYGMYGEELRASTSTETVRLRLPEYNRTWRLWREYPSGTERHHQEWEGPSA